MKRAIIIHCWDGTPEYCWYPQVKKDLEQLGLAVDVPAMPDTAHPSLDAWLQKLIEVVGDNDDELFLIGHSIGTVCLMRFLEQGKFRQKISAVILVAGFTDDLGFKELTNFFPKPLDFDAISRASENFIVVTSDNDPYVPIHYAKELVQKLKAQLILKPNFGHFSGSVDKEDSCLSIPEITQEIKQMIQHA